jgi:hypothetical protein
VLHRGGFCGLLLMRRWRRPVPRHDARGALGIFVCIHPRPAPLARLLLPGLHHRLRPGAAALAGLLLPAGLLAAATPLGLRPRQRGLHPLAQRPRTAHRRRGARQRADPEGSLPDSHKALLQHSHAGGELCCRARGATQLRDAGVQRGGARALSCGTSGQRESETRRCARRRRRGRTSFSSAASARTRPSSAAWSAPEARLATAANSAARFSAAAQSRCRFSSSAARAWRDGGTCQGVRVSRRDAARNSPPSPSGAAHWRPAQQSQPLGASAARPRSCPGAGVAPEAAVECTQAGDGLAPVSRAEKCTWWVCLWHTSADNSAMCVMTAGTLRHSPPSDQTALRAGVAHCEKCEALAILGPRGNAESSATASAIRIRITQA